MSNNGGYLKQEAYPEPQQQEEYDDVSGGLAQAASNGHHGHIAATGMPELPSRPAYKLSEETETFIQQAEAELALLGLHSPIVRQLAERELARIKAGEVSEAGYVIVHKDAPIKVKNEFLIPIKEYPKVLYGGSQNPGMPPPGIRLPMGHGPREPQPPWGYSLPRPPMGARYPPPPRSVPPMAYQAPSYKYNAVVAAPPAAETSYRLATTATYGCAAYPANQYAIAPTTSGYNSLMVQASEYGAEPKDITGSTQLIAHSPASMASRGEFQSCRRDRLLESVGGIVLDPFERERSFSSSVDLKLRTGNDLVSVKTKKSKTIRETKDLIQRRFGLAPSSYRISTPTNDLAEKRTIRSYPIESHSKLILTQPLVGGMMGNQAVPNYGAPGPHNVWYYQQNIGALEGMLDRQQFRDVIMGFVAGPYPPNNVITPWRRFFSLVELALRVLKKTNQPRATKQFYKEYLVRLETLALEIPRLSVRVEELIADLLNTHQFQIPHKRKAVCQIVQLYEQSFLNPDNVQFLFFNGRLNTDNFVNL
ncbi:hypothetical protein BV898_16385 [Hypsibius exemplaris]|uniref:Ubiquitin-like domain-containing protein n=1 Tax=Hypsibius exemplaris TaxID=2072580 RepID=A0A9X6NDK0_HYPEX|nr:hypothetical protein BV898_16385 [Hypsibius exemplaris]